jgi:TonB family protein
MVPFVVAACPLPDAIPVVERMPVGSNLPYELGLHGSTQLIVTLSETGELKDVVLSESSGITALDAAAIGAARHAAFAPEVHNCAPVGGSYFLTIEY